MSEILALLALGAVVAYWLDGLRAREAAMRAARTACARHDLQLLDETVAQVRLRLARHADGRVGLRRTYHFEFSDDGGSRREGTIEMLGHRVTASHLALAPYTLHEMD